MKISKELETLFEIPENHTPVVLISGGTDFEHFTRNCGDMLDESKTKGMDENAARAGLPLSPFMVLLVQGADNHVHALASLPLQKWQYDLRLEPSIEESKDVRRVTDWVAGLIDLFCKDDTVHGMNLITGDIVFGDPKEGQMSLEATVREVTPKREVRGTSNIDMEDLGDFIGQLSKKEIEEKVGKKKKSNVDIVEEGLEALRELTGRTLAPKEKAQLLEIAQKEDGVAPVKRTPIKTKEEKVEVVDGEKTKKLIKEQKDIVKKFGYDALKEMSERMKFDILIENPHG